MTDRQEPLTPKEESGRAMTDTRYPPLEVGPYTLTNYAAECDEVCTSSCHASDCEHHGHLPERAARQEAAPESEHTHYPLTDSSGTVFSYTHPASVCPYCARQEAADTSGLRIDPLRLARAIEVHMTGKWYDPVYKSDFEWAESLAALYADLPDEHEERGR